MCPSEQFDGVFFDLFTFSWKILLWILCCPCMLCYEMVALDDTDVDHDPSYNRIVLDEINGDAGTYDLR